MGSSKVLPNYKRSSLCVNVNNYNLIWLDYVNYANRGAVKSAIVHDRSKSSKWMMIICSVYTMCC